MNDHIPDVTKMISDTPRTDAAEYESQDEPVAKLGSVDVDFARQIERELNAANVEIEEKRKDIVYLATEKAKLEERIKRLEEELMDTKNNHAALVADVVLNEDRAAHIKQLEAENDAMRADLLLWNENEVKL